MKIRVGFGFDVHQLVEGRELWLGGVLLEHTKGLLGHSDADVLLHAIMDAMLGAAALGDIGRHFPDTDPAYKGADSMVLLQACRDRIRAAGYRVHNLDALICAQAPKMAPHIETMRANIARALALEVDAVNVKATTTERLGFVGDGSGISAYAVCLLEDADA